MYYINNLLKNQKKKTKIFFLIKFENKNFKKKKKLNMENSNN